MTNSMLPQTDSDVFAEIVEPMTPDLSADAARAILDLRFNASAIQRMNELAEKNQSDGLNAEERATLDRYMRVGSFINLLQAKARLSLVAHEKS